MLKLDVFHHKGHALVATFQRTLHTPKKGAFDVCAFKMSLQLFLAHFMATVCCVLIPEQINGEEKKVVTKTLQLRCTPKVSSTLVNTLLRVRGATHS